MLSWPWLEAENKENKATTKQQETGDVKEDDSKALTDDIREKERIAHRQSRREKWQKNVKSDLTSQPESSDPDEIRKQVRMAIRFEIGTMISIIWD